MFAHATRMRHSTDCGIAALATATGKSWVRCKRALGPHAGSADGAIYYGTELDTMRAAIGAMPSGARLAEARGMRGVVLCRVEREGAWADGRHWLAWEKDEHGRVWCFNPTDGKVFRAESMTGRGFYPICHFTVA